MFDFIVFEGVLFVLFVLGVIDVVNIYIFEVMCGLLVNFFVCDYVICYVINWMGNDGWLKIILWLIMDL